MSTVVVMPAVSESVGRPPLPGRILKTYRMPQHTVDVGEPLADVLVGRNIVTVCANRDGFLYRIALVGDQVKAGDVIATVGGALSPQYTHEIFIAYRRADSLGHAGRVGELLMRDFGRWQVFKDIESLPPGQDFVECVRAAMGRALVVVVIVGPRWLTLSGPDGQRRLDDPTDLHREEIRTALERGLPVYPVLVDGATMPRPSELPDDIRPFSTRTAFELTDSRWEYDTSRFTGALAKVLIGAKDRRDPHEGR